jgi:hypothetical protein
MRNNVGSQGEDPDVDFTDGVLYRIDPDGTTSTWKENIGMSNTVTWSPDHKTSYFGDSPANAIYSYAYDEETGVISGESKFLVGYPQGLSDGSVIGRQGYPSFRPNLLSSDITLLHHGSLPKAIPTTLDELIRAEHICVLVSVHARVRPADLAYTPLCCPRNLAGRSAQHVLFEVLKCEFGS